VAALAVGAFVPVGRLAAQKDVTRHPAEDGMPGFDHLGRPV
jgi:hypothetical protein